MDWGGDAPLPLIADVRAAAAPLCIALRWWTLLESKAHHAPHLMRAHINVLEFEVVLWLLKRLRREGLRNARILVYVDSRVPLRKGVPPPIASITCCGRMRALASAAGLRWISYGNLHGRSFSGIDFHSSI